jgi:hypothetical protein
MAAMNMSFLIGAAAQFLGAGVAFIWLRRDSLQTKAHRAADASEVTLSRSVT